VRAGSLDVAVVSDHPTGALDDSGIALTSLTDDPLLVALPADHPLVGEDGVDLADLADEAWVQGGPDDGSSTLAAAAARAGFRPRIEMAVASWSAKRSLVAAGLGVTLVPALMGPTFLAAGPEVVLRSLTDHALGPRHVAAALPAVTRPLPAAQHFVNELRQAITATPWPP
jgi:DNA-binding transcriptional LysR family regulator